VLQSGQAQDEILLDLTGILDFFEVSQFCSLIDALRSTRALRNSCSSAWSRREIARDVYDIAPTAWGSSSKSRNAVEQGGPAASSMRGVSSRM